MPAAQQELSPPGMFKEMQDIPPGLLRPVLADSLIDQIEAVVYDQRMHWLIRGPKVQYRAKCGVFHPIAEGWTFLIADSDGLNPSDVRADYEVLYPHLTDHGFEVCAFLYRKDDKVGQLVQRPEDWPENLTGIVGVSIMIHPPRGFEGRLPLCR